MRYCLTSLSCSTGKVLQICFNFFKDFNLFLTFYLTLFINRSIAVSSSLCFNLRLPASSSIALSISFLRLEYFKDYGSLKLWPLVKSLLTFWFLIRRRSSVMICPWSWSQNSEFSQLQKYISSFSDCPSIDSTVF